jgi:MFS family permease
MVGYVVDIWYSENKGTIMGIILASNGIGGAIAIQIVGLFIDPSVTGSYRTAYTVIAAVLAVTALVLLLFFRNEPSVKSESAEELPKSKSKSKKRGSKWSGIPFSDTLRKPYFWGALVCIFFSGFCLQGINGIVAMHFKDVGIDYTAVKSMLSFGSLLLATSKFLVGFVYDKFGVRVVSSFCMIISIISSFILAMTGAGGAGMVLAVIFVILCQFALPLETIMLPVYATDLFGELSYANVLGIFVSVNVAGFALGAPVMNLCYDIFGTYVPAIVMVGFIMCAIFVLIQFVISAAHKERRCVEEKEVTTVSA